MADGGKGTPVTQEWLVMMALGYFVGGPLLGLLIWAIYVLAKWMIA